MHHEQIVKQDLQRKLRAHTCQSMTRKATQASVFFDISKHDFDRLTPQAVYRLRFSGRHSGPMGLDQLFVIATLHTAPALLTRRTLSAQGTSLAGLRLAPVLSLDPFASATASPGVATDPLEQMACRTLIGIEVAAPRQAILTKPRARLRFAPVVGWPWPIKRHVLRRTHGQVHARHIGTID